MIPSIKKVQHNRETDHEFQGVGPVEQEYSEQINHDGPGARIVLENGNWIEFRKLDDDTMEECVFVQGTRPDGRREAFLEDSIEIGALGIPTVGEFYECVNTSIGVYQELETPEDAERDWTNIVPALTED